MTDDEWQLSTDAIAMLNAIWDVSDKYDVVLVLKVQGYLAACARRIWPLLKDPDSRKSVEYAEMLVANTVNPTTVNSFDWYSEAAAFGIDYDTRPEINALWVREIEAIPADELMAMFNPAIKHVPCDARTLLRDVAYFANHVMMYPWISSRTADRRVERYLSADLLREHFGNRLSSPDRSGPAADRDNSWLPRLRE